MNTSTTAHRLHGGADNWCYKFLAASAAAVNGTIDLNITLLHHVTFLYYVIQIRHTWAAYRCANRRAGSWAWWRPAHLGAVASTAQPKHSFSQ